MAKGRKQTIPIAQLVRKPELQMRALGVSKEHAEDLSEAVAKNAKLPPVQVMVVAEMGQLVTDGFHTVEAYEKAGRKTVPCEIRVGTWAEAVIAACGANLHVKSALKRTHADKRRAVQELNRILKNEGMRWSINRRAEHCGVSPALVKELEPAEEDEPVAEDVKTVGKDGKEYGKRPLPRRDPAAPREHPPIDVMPKTAKAFDWRLCEAQIGSLARSIESLDSLYQIKKTPHYERMRSTLAAFERVFTNCRNELEKQHGN